MKLFLGVDGGNSKTDFFLFNEQGTCLSYYGMGTCSHEQLGGMDGACRQLECGIRAVCNGIDPAEITYTVMGLAGADIPRQYHALEKRISAFFPGKFRVCNDSLLGIKAALPGGVGLCCINGTGSTVSAVDADGTVLQNGGIGFVSSDFSGGQFLSQEVLRRVYNHCCRDGVQTALTPGVFRILGLPADANLLESFHPELLKIRKYELELDRLLFQCALQGDSAACEIVANSAEEMAATTAGCIKRLHFPEIIPIVLAGSIWVKCGYPALKAQYLKAVTERTHRKLDCHILKAPPALGAVLWAMELGTGAAPSEALRSRTEQEILAAKSRLR